MRQSFKLAFALLSLLFSLNTYAQAEKLIFAIDVIRHGDRSPIIDLPKSPYEWPQGLGQLSPTGMQQEFQLGSAMRKHYIEEAQLLPQNFNTQTLYVRSSDFNRTLMSAESLLMGLYPLGTGPSLPHTDSPALPSAYQAIPIHTVPQDLDTLFVEHGKFKDILEQHVFNQADWKQKTAELQPQFARWSELTGIKITHLTQLITLADSLMIRQLYQVPRPQGMTEHDEEIIIGAGHWAFVALYKSTDFGKACVGELLTKIQDYMEEASQHKSKLKYVLFSGHDATILALMSAMKTPMDKTPPYASDLNFSLYETAAGETRVKVTLNGEAVILPVCGKVLCKLTQFKA